MHSKSHHIEKEREDLSMDENDSWEEKYSKQAKKQDRLKNIDEEGVKDGLVKNKPMYKNDSY